MLEYKKIIIFALNIIKKILLSDKTRTAIKENRNFSLFM